MTNSIAKKTVFLLLVMVAFLTNSYSQFPSKIWMFGNDAGIDFNSPAPKFINPGTLFTSESGTTLTDESGNLLFYVSNNTAYNKNKKAMPNGWGLTCNGGSSAQSPLILQNPANPRQFYVFIAADESITGCQGVLRYSIIDMCLDNGLGDVMAGRKNITIPGKYSERLTAIPLNNGAAYWIISSQLFGTTIYTFYLDKTGINTIPVISNFTPAHSAQVGFIVANHKKDQLLYSSCLDINNGVWLMDFDTLTGKASNKVEIELNKHLYGIAFSPNDKRIYYGYLYGRSGIYQYDLENKVETELVEFSGNYLFGQIVEGPDKKIYIAKPNQNHLAAIVDPDLQGTSCGYVNNYISLGSGSCNLSLQNKEINYGIQKNLSKVTGFLGRDTILCGSFNITLSVNHPSPQWSDGSTNRDLIVTKPGTYWVTFEDCLTLYSDTIEIKDNSSSYSIVQSACDSVIINGQRYTQSGNYVQLLKNANQCDSIINIDLNISKSSISNVSLTSCDSAIINGQRYTQSGNYVQVLKNANLCDSIININLDISKSSTSIVSIISCDSAIINGQGYTQSGNYVQKLKNANHCDSIINIDLSISKSSTSNVSLTSCDTANINGQSYTQTGNYVQVLKNANQCDSIIRIDLNISTRSTSFVNLTSCDSAIINGQSYTQSGNYVQVLKNTNQCDSLINIDLNISKSSTSSVSLTSCDSMIINGEKYFSSGQYKQVLNNSHNCDSIINIKLEILQGSQEQITLRACDSIVVNFIKYNQSGNYQQKLQSTNGCDSLIDLNLTINSTVPSSLNAGNDISECDGENIQLHGAYSGAGTFSWYSTTGNFEYPNRLITNYYPSTTGVHSIYLRSENECSNLIDSLIIHILPRQIIQVTGDTILNPCDEITFTAIGGANYIWTPSSIIECLDPLCTKIRLKSTGTATITVSTDGPCVVPAVLNLSALKIFSDIFVPNVFSPNGDNINDIFFPVISCDKLEYYHLEIFDRWGNLVFESFDKDVGWNGSFHTEKMNPSVFTFLIEYKFPTSNKMLKSGNVTLIR